MKKTTVTTVLILGAIILAFFAFQKTTCFRCNGSGTQKMMAKQTCTACKGRTTLQCNYYIDLKQRRFINNNLDVSYYDCKGGRYKTRKGYADYFGKDGDICEACNGSGRVECGRCDGYGSLSTTKNHKDNFCGGTGKIPSYKKWFH